MDDAGKRIIYLYRDSSYSNIFGDMGRNLLSGEGQAESFQKLRHILAYNIPVMGRASDIGRSANRKIKTGGKLQKPG